MQGSPENDEGFAAAKYFEKVFPGAVINVDDVPLPEHALQNLSAAGLGAAEVIQADGSICVATFLLREADVTDMVSAIYDLEACGSLPEGSHQQALDDIMDGSFNNKWGYLFS